MSIDRAVAHPLVLLTHASPGVLWDIILVVTLTRMVVSVAAVIDVISWAHLRYRERI